jgi:hypothetical protein
MNTKEFYDGLHSRIKMYGVSKNISIKQKTLIISAVMSYLDDYGFIDRNKLQVVMGREL